MVDFFSWVTGQLSSWTLYQYVMVFLTIVGIYLLLSLAARVTSLSFFLIELRTRLEWIWESASGVKSDSEQIQGSVDRIDDRVEQIEEYVKNEWEFKRNPQKFYDKSDGIP